MPFGFPDHNTGQANQRNQVGDCHQAVQGVSDTPSQAQFHRRADEDDHQEDDLIGLNRLRAKEEFAAPGAIQRPAQDGGERKQRQLF